MAVLNDNSPMPYGKHKDVEMANVPADYLIWLYENDKANKDVKQYVINNIDVLRKQVREAKGEDEWNLPF